MSEIIVNVDAENIPVVQIMVDENSAQTAIDAAAAAQAALDAIGSTNFGDKLDKSTYTGNAQDLKNDIDAIALPDDILIHGAAPVTNGTVNIAANAFRWRLSQIIYNNAAYSNLINPAANGHSRIDLFCLNNLGTFEKVVGDELIGIAPEPAPNAGTLGAFFVAVNGAVIGTPSPIMTSNKPILEREKQPFHVYNTGEINDTFLEDFFYGYLNFRGAVTNLKSIRVYQNTFLYSGKEILVKNSQATDITLFHLTGLGFQFSFPNAQNLVLKPNEIIRFSMKITDPSSGVLEYVGRLTEAPTVAVADVVGLPEALDLKLNTSAYNQHFRGVYLTELALNTALPTANVGDYAQVNVVGETDVVNYNWDAEENIWVINAVASSGALNTDQLPEGTSNLYFTVARFLANLTTANIKAALGITTLSGANTGDQDLSGKVDKVTGKSLISDTEITRLAGVVNFDGSTKQNTLVPGTNIKTINGTSLLGSGDIVIAGSGEVNYYVQLINTKPAGATNWYYNLLGSLLIFNYSTANTSLSTQLARQDMRSVFKAKANSKVYGIKIHSDSTRPVTYSFGIIKGKKTNNSYFYQDSLLNGVIVCEITITFTGTQQIKNNYTYTIGSGINDITIAADEELFCLTKQDTNAPDYFPEVHLYIKEV